MKSNQCQIAIAQMNSSDKVEENLKQLNEIVNDHQKPIDIMFLPENFAHMPVTEKDRLDSAEEFGSGRIQDFLAELAKTKNAWIVAGSVPLLLENKGKIYQSTLVFDDLGQCQQRYDKIHLFDVELANGERYEESSYIEFGDKQQQPWVSTPWGSIGLSICYDLRFPEHFRAFPEDVFLLSIPAAFTHRTGKAHWQVLLQARAIENQCYVAAAAQTGTHSNGRKTWGHSSVINPWGDIISQNPNDIGLIDATVDIGFLQKIRQQLPCLHQKRTP